MISPPSSTPAVASSPDPDQAAAAVVGVAEHWQPGSLAEHAHHRHQLMYSIQGTIHVTTASGRWVLPPSRAIWIRGGTPHSFASRRPVQVQVLYVDPGVMQALTWQDCEVITVTPLVRELVAASVQLPWDYPHDSPADRLVKVLLEQLVHLPRAPVSLPEPIDARARKVAARLREDPARREPLQALAEIAAVSPRTLERLFQVETGLSFAQWRQRLRLVEGLELLSEGCSVSQAASAVGYDNASSFISAFRRLFGTTPGSYFG